MRLVLSHLQARTCGVFKCDAVAVCAALIIFLTRYDFNWGSRCFASKLSHTHAVHQVLFVVDQGINLIFTMDMVLQVAP